MEQERAMLEKLIASGASYEKILKQSQKLDKYIVAAMKGCACNG